VSDAVVYQVFPDRFARSARVEKPRNLEPWDSPPSLFGFKGGDLFGVLERLDYIQDLGADTIYLNPIFASTANHRYHTHDYFKVDPLLGGDAALRALLDEAHRRGLRVLLDGVFNHASRSFYQFNHTLENGLRSPYLDWFHFNREWLAEGRPLDPYAVAPLREERPEHESSLERFGYRAWWDIPALPKFNTDHPEVRALLFSVAEHWIAFGADGWRLDVPSEIDDDGFWREFKSRVRRHNPEAYVVGEIWEDPTRWLQPGLFDGVTSYPFAETVLGYAFGQRLDRGELSHCGLRHTTGLSAAACARRLEQLYAQEPYGAIWGQLNVLGSHDTPRILNAGRGDTAGVLLAFTCLFGFPGAPCVYYGDEIGLAGRHDPDCRRAFEWDDKLWDRATHRHLRALAHARRSSHALRRGDFKVLVAEEDQLAWRRLAEGRDEALIAVNAGIHRRTLRLPVGMPGEAVYRDALRPDLPPLRVIEGAVHVNLDARSSSVLTRLS
jgi:neopullulanase